MGLGLIIMKLSHVMTLQVFISLGWQIVSFSTGAALAVGATVSSMTMRRRLLKPLLFNWKTLWEPPPKLGCTSLFFKQLSVTFLPLQLDGRVFSKDLTFYCVNITTHRNYNPFFNQFMYIKKGVLLSEVTRRFGYKSEHNYAIYAEVTAISDR